VLCGLAWGLALKLPFERLISIDLILYGSSLLLEFVALAVLRVREPNLGAAIQGRQFCRCLPAGRWSGGVDRLCTLCLAGREDHRHNFRAAFRAWRGTAGPVLYWATAAPLARRRPAVVTRSN